MRHRTVSLSHHIGIAINPGASFACYSGAMTAALRRISSDSFGAWAALLAGCWAIAVAVGWNLPFNNDVSWQYWVARQLIGGARFYRDIAESNPPLWFWEAVPVTMVGNALHVAPRHIAVAWIMARIAIAVGLVVALSPDHKVRRAIAAAVIAIALTLFDFGERDPLMAIGALPFILLIAARFENRPVPVPLAVITGLFAGLGFALKPHFLLVPVALELWLAWRQRRGWRAIRPETVAIAALLAIYAGAVAVVTPDYFTRELPLVLAAYGDFKPPFLDLWVNQIYLPVWIVGTVVCVFARRNAEATSAAVATLAFAIIYAVQGKGFPYQAVPVTIGMCWACWLLLESESRLLLRLGAIIVFGGALVIAALIGPFKPSRLGAISTRLEALPPGATYALISTHSWDAFPLVEDRRLVWPMRGFLLWTMPGIARDPASALAQRTRDEIVADLWCHPPDAILFDDPARSPAMPRNGFDYYGFVAADPSARELLSAYRPVERVGGTTLWLRQSSLTPRGTDCRAISIRPDYR